MSEVLRFGKKQGNRYYFPERIAYIRDIITIDPIQIGVFMFENIYLSDNYCALYVEKNTTLKC